MANDMRETSGGGISFRSPIFSFGTTVPEINSGYSFDLPLATIQSFSNQALTFTANNSAQNRGFLDSVFSRSQSQVTATAANAYAYQGQALGVLGSVSTGMQRSIDNAVKRKSRGCFITTAICKNSGLPDDCDELKTLRHFRDTIMYNNVEWRNLIAKYYEVAPGIVTAIEARSDADEIFSLLDRGYLQSAILAVKRGEHEKAISIYREMVQTAKSFADEVTHG